MSEWEAPAKLNLSLLVGPPGDDGYHPIRSLVQTLDWVDRLAIEVADEDRLDIRGAELDPGPTNLVWVAADALAMAVSRQRPPLDVQLDKRVAVAAGLGGGSADAAAVLGAVAEIMDVEAEVVARIAPRIGADVPLFFVGGTCWIEGRGERVRRHRPALEGVAAAVVVPPFELPTGSVYAMWDRLEGPEGPLWNERDVPPPLRSEGPLRNDLYPAAVALRPDLAEWRAELARIWGVDVVMTGSGPALFALFSSEGEAVEAVEAAPPEARSVAAAVMRTRGVARRASWGSGGETARSKGLGSVG